MRSNLLLADMIAPNGLPLGSGKAIMTGNQEHYPGESL